MRYRLCIRNTLRCEEPLDNTRLQWVYPLFLGFLRYDLPHTFSLTA